MASSGNTPPQRRSPWREKGASQRSEGHDIMQEVNNNTKYDIQEEGISTQAFPIRSQFGIFVHAIVCIGWLLYLGVRLVTCLQASTSLSRTSGSLWLFFWCEVILASPDLFLVMELSLWFVPSKSPTPRPCYRINGDNAPLVHVFITTCGEDVDIIMETVAGAAIQDYPKHSYRIFVLDDASESKLANKVNEFNLRACERLDVQPIVYLTRAKKPGVAHYHKSGNLDFGIGISHTQYGSSEFIAGLDADMLPEYDWLKRTVPHLLRSPELALVSPPQYSYNVSENDILAQDANVLQQILEPVRDRVGCSMCHGSGYVLRREALRAIGGWPLVNLGEDILCSYQLNRAGWQTAFIKDKLQFGLAPESFHGYVSQRMRWTAGNLQSAKMFKFFLPYLNRSRITGVQRFHGLMQAVKTYAWAALIIPLLILPICLPLIGGSERYEEVIWNREITRYVYITAWVALKVWKQMVFAHLGATNVSNLAKNRLWITPYITYAFCEAHWVNRGETKFNISGTFESPVNERSEKDRAAFWGRMTDSLVLMHTVYWLLATGGFLVWIWSVGRFLASSSGSSAYFHTGVTIRFLDIVLAALVPVKYMALPSASVNRQEGLVKDRFGAHRAATKAWTKRGNNLVSSKDLVELLIIVMCDWV